MQCNRLWLGLIGLAIFGGQSAEAQLFPNMWIRRQRPDPSSESPIYKMNRDQFYGLHPTEWRRFPTGWGLTNPEAINRDEMAASVVKEARLKGELSLSQTNEIVKLNKQDQKSALKHIQELPVREIKKFVKLAKAQGVQEAISATPNVPFQKEFQEIDMGLKKLIKKFKQFQMEGIDVASFPDETQELFGELMKFSDADNFSSHSRDEDRDMDSLQ